MRRLLIVGISLLTLLTLRNASVAQSRVHLNAVDVTGLRNQTFVNAEVRFDERGDVWISAPGYAVKVRGTTKSPSAQRVPTTWVIVEERRVGAAQFEIDVFINGKFAVKVPAKGVRAPIEVTDFVRLGKNTVRFEAVKQHGEGERVSTSARDTIAVSLGTGAMTAATLKLTRILATFSRSAADLERTVTQSAFELKATP